MATATQAKLSFRQLENLYIANGGSPKFAPVMAAIALAESRGRVNAKHVNSDGTIDQGLWQINSSNSRLYKGKDINNPNVNAKAAIQLAEHSGNGLRNWVTFTKGTYKRFLKMPKTLSRKTKAATAGILTPDNYVGTDQGVDFKGAGSIPALGSGVVTDVGKVNIIEGGQWPYVVYRLTDGPYKGHFVYVMENFLPSVKKGSRVAMGQTIGRAVGKFPYVEVGFNRTGSGLNPVAPLSPTNPHSATPAGSTMWNYIQGVTGLKKGGGGGGITGALGGAASDVGGALSGAGSAVWNFNPFSSAGSAIGDATGIHPERWVKEALTTVVDALAIAGGGFIFIFGFALIAADIGLSSRAGRVVAAVPAGRYIARGARSTASSRSSRQTSTPKRNKHITPSETGPQPRTRRVVHVHRDETDAERRRRMSSGKSSQSDDIPF